MGEEHKTSSRKKVKRKKTEDGEVQNEPEDSVCKRKKKDKNVRNGNNDLCPGEDEKKTKNAKVKANQKMDKNDDTSDKDNEEYQLLISDVSKMVTELFDGYKKETGNGQSKKSKSKKKKKEETRQEEADNGHANNHKIFNDDDNDLASKIVNERDEENVKKKKKKKKSKVEVEEGVLNCNINDKINNLYSEISDCVKKGKKKRKENSESLVLDKDSENQTKKKKKKSKRAEQESDTVINDLPAANNCEMDMVIVDKADESQKKKRKGTKYHDINVSHASQYDMNSLDDDNRKKKEKKMKVTENKNDTVISDLSAVNSLDEDSVNDSQKTKKKKRKGTENKHDINDDMNSLDDSKRKKKEKKTKVIENKTDTVISDLSAVNSLDEDIANDSQKKKKKKRKSKEVRNEMGTVLNNSLDANHCDRNYVSDEKRQAKMAGELEGKYIDIMVNNVDDATVKSESAGREKGRKRKHKGPEECDSNKSSQEQMIMNANCESEKKKKKKSKNGKDKDSVVELGQFKHEKATQKDSEKTESKGEESESEKSMKKKRKENNITVPFQQTLNSPVFESEERQEKFKRLLGGKKNTSNHLLGITKNLSNNTSCIENTVINDRDVSSPALSAGQWNGMLFESSERQSKFIRLLGGAKSSVEKKKGIFSPGSTTPKKGLFGSLVSKTDSNGAGKALGLEAAASLNKNLEDDYNMALSRRLNGAGSSGLGFVKDPAEGKKFHINTNVVKSTKFSDDE